MGNLELPDEDLVRRVCLAACQSFDIADYAHRQFGAHGRGHVVFEWQELEAWDAAGQPGGEVAFHVVYATSFDMPGEDRPEELRRAVADYNPGIECVCTVVFVPPEQMAGDVQTAAHFRGRYFGTIYRFPNLN